MKDNGKKFQFAPRSRTEISDASGVIELALGGDLEKFRDYIQSFPEVINIKEKDHGNVALHVSSSKGNISMTSLLLSKGANPNIQDIFGNTPLHYAVDKKKKDVAELLLKCGSDINAKDFRGNTPLHTACANNDIDIVRMLLMANADPEISDLSDIKPIQKTTSAPVRALLERRIQSIHGNNEDSAAKIVQMMSFGIGLGVGLGMAMAKQQQFHSEQQLQAQLLQAKSKRRGAPGMQQQHGNMGMALVPSEDSESVSFSPHQTPAQGSSRALTNAGAMVLHNPPNKNLPERRLL